MTIIRFSVFVASLLSAVLTVSPASAVSADAPGVPPLGPPIADAVTTERLEAMLTNGDESMLVQTFRRHPSRVLPFIDGYLEGGLELVEKSDGGIAGPVPEEVRERYRLGIRFAELADRAFGETIFVEYAAAFASWSPQERARFREGQRLYREGRQLLAEKPAETFALYRRSLLLAESVGDHWGMAMANAGIAVAADRAGRADEAHEASIKSVSLYGRLQLRESQARAMLTTGRLQAKLELPGGGVQYLLLARQMLPLEVDPALREEILTSLIEGLEKAGRNADIERIRQEEKRRDEVLGAS